MNNIDVNYFDEDGNLSEIISSGRYGSILKL
jgi:hypothetical protein